MPVNVGDAVMTFVGDSSQLDQTFDSIPGKAQVAFTGFDAVIDENKEHWDGLSQNVEVNTEQINTSVRGAREEVRFLGEETGIRLPRAIAGLVAGMPGVAQAINVAFAATAIVFAIQLIDTLTKKLIDLATAGSNAQAQVALALLVAENNEYVKLNAAIDTADRALVAAIDTRTTLQKLQAQLIDQQKQLSDASKVDESEILNAKRVDASAGLTIVRYTLCKPLPSGVSGAYLFARSGRSLAM